MHICVTYGGGGGAEAERKLYSEDLDSFSLCLPPYIFRNIYFSLLQTDRTKPTLLALQKAFDFLRNIRQALRASLERPGTGAQVHREGWWGGRGGALLCDLGLFLCAFQALNSVSCKDRRDDTFPTEAVTRVHPGGVSSYRRLPSFLPRSSPAPGSSLVPAVATRPQSGDLGFSVLGVPVLPLLPASGLPTRGSRGPDRS